MSTLDTIRAKYPHLGAAVYAYEPSGPLSLEIISADGKLFLFKGATEADAVSAFLSTLVDDEPAPPTEPPPPAPPTPSVFD